MIHGYARVSTSEQDPRLQLDALARAGVDRIWQEKQSAVLRRPELASMLQAIQPGDLVVFWKLDRLARSLRDLLDIIDRVQAAGASIRSLTEPIDTSTPIGLLLIQVLGGFAQFERAVIRERAAAGREAAKARGVRFGRPRTVDMARIVELDAQGLTHKQIAEVLGCDRSYAGKLVRRAVREGVSPS